jgi:propanol-preferring alcohol dehydrogenase
MKAEGAMRAAVLRKAGPIETRPLEVADVAMPRPAEGEVLLRVKACGVCHTDLHIAEGDLKEPKEHVIPGHQIVGEVVESGDAKWRPGMRAGVSWMGGVDGTCSYCRTGRENLCDRPVFTGYTRDGGYAEFATARADFLLPLPEALDHEQAAPLLCAGIIGYRSVKVAEAKKGQRVGLYGFGASAQLILPVLQAWGCRVYVATREARHREHARQMGADWVGEGEEVPPDGLDCAITFAPAGAVVLAALKSLAKGGIVAINAIHLDRMPEFDYDTLLWGERQIRSVANMTRADGREFLEEAAKIGLKPESKRYALEEANEALRAIRKGEFTTPSVIVP